MRDREGISRYIAPQYYGIPSHSSTLHRETSKTTVHRRKHSEPFPSCIDPSTRKPVSNPPSKHTLKVQPLTISTITEYVPATSTLFLIPLPLLNQHKPHDGREIKREPRNEQRRTYRQQVGGERNCFSNDPSDDGDEGNECKPGDPPFFGVDEADYRVFVHAAVDVMYGDTGTRGGGYTIILVLNNGVGKDNVIAG